jgi:hypothetical protein
LPNTCLEEEEEEEIVNDGKVERNKMKEKIYFW